ncbi:MAG: hypothetical protein ACREA0_10340, partial [bacterium]
LDLNGGRLTKRGNASFQARLDKSIGCRWSPLTSSDGGDGSCAAAAVDGSGKLSSLRGIRAGAVTHGPEGRHEDDEEDNGGHRQLGLQLGGAWGA